MPAKKTVKKSISSSLLFSPKKLFNKTSAAFLITALVLVGIYIVFITRASAPIAASRFAPDQLLLRFRSGADAATQQKLLSRYGLAVKSDIPQIQTKVVTVNPKALDAVVTALSHNPAVEFVEKDWVRDPTAVVPNDPFYNGTADSYNYQWPFTVTRTNDAWDKTTGSNNVVIAVLDTGIDLSQPDLGILVPGWNVVNNNSDITYTNSHGVYTSGVVNAHSNNGVGVASTCWQCSVMMIKVSTMSSGSAYGSDLAKGITYAADHGAKIINISYGGTTSDSAERSAEQYALNKGLLIFGAAGNSGCDCPAYPAADPGVIGVTDVGGSTGDFINENYGSWVKIAAPSGVTTTVPSTLIDPPYSPVGGTSISSPFAAGVAGLLWSAQPQATAAQIRDAIFNTANQFTDRLHPERTTQYGRINSYNAMTALTGSFVVTPPDTTAPTASVTSPASGTKASGQTIINVSASDNVGVAKVTARVYAFINGAVQEWSLGTDTTAPYSFYWDTTVGANANYHVCTSAYDTSFNISAESCNSSIAVQNSTTPDTTPPTTNLAAPATGTTVSGTATVSASSSDNIGVTATELYVDGLLRSSTTTNSLSYSWDTNQEANGSHTLVVKAYDAAGNVGTSPTTTVTISNLSDTVAPTVTITSPAPNTFLAGTITVSGSATDNLVVTKMELYLDGKLKTTSATATISASWNTKPLKKGSHTILIKAFDAAGNVGTGSVTVSKL